MYPTPLGRPRLLTPKRKEELIQHVAKGASVEEAARVVGITLRTVQREAKYDDVFDHELQLTLHNSHPDPYDMMMRACRTHWRAAAWMLERTDPERFAKRKPDSCPAYKLEALTALLVETALAATPAEHREAVYRSTQAVADKAVDLLMPRETHDRLQRIESLLSRPTPNANREVVKLMHQRATEPSTVCHSPRASGNAVHASLASASLPPKPLQGHDETCVNDRLDAESRRTSHWQDASGTQEGADSVCHGGAARANLVHAPLAAGNVTPKPLQGHDGTLVDDQVEAEPCRTSHWQDASGTPDHDSARDCQDGILSLEMRCRDNTQTTTVTSPAVASTAPPAAASECEDVGEEFQRWIDEDLSQPPGAKVAFALPVTPAQLAEARTWRRFLKRRKRDDDRNNKTHNNKTHTQRTPPPAECPRAA